MISRGSTEPGLAAGAGIAPARIISFISLMPGFAAQRERFLADHLAAVVFAGIVRRGDLRAAVEIVGRHRVIHLVGADQAVIEDGAALQDRAVDERLGQRRRRHAHVARHGVTARAQVGDEGAAELVEQLLGDLGRVEARARRRP